MEEKETIAEYIFKINNLVNNIKSLGEDIKDSDVCKKIPRSLTSRSNPRVTILEDKDLTNMKIDELQASLTAYEMRIGPPTLLRETTLKAKEVVEEVDTKSEDDLEEDEVLFLAKKFKKFSKPGHVVSNCPSSKGQYQRKFEGPNNKGRFERKPLITDWDIAPEEEKSEEPQEDDCFFMAILETPIYSFQVEEDSDTEIEEILEECERLAVKCNTQWSTKRCKEELPLILEERSLKMAKIWKQSTKQIGKTRIGYVYDTALQFKQNHSVLVKATTGEVYASGYSRHMTSDGSKFVSLKQFDRGNVVFGDNKKAKIMSKFEELPEIQEVLLFEGLKHNLLSVSQVCDSRKRICFNKEKCNVVDLKSKQVLFTACRSSGNVYLVTEETQSTQCNLTTCD
ncbi:uncharacterized protein LOC132301551 [Cornus florida]|uniref:uncharacterized protein LOC132301551 n=1 Tax=Cornus florida TaxID=4283 RepID=UPI0028A2DE06|nr:uncharacterized protein LOC132301551 [Cornus florida]